MSGSDDVIDLTNSFTLSNHCGLSNIVIDLDTDDSFCIDSNCSPGSARVYPRQSNVKPTLRVPAVITPDTSAIKKQKLTKKKSLNKRKSGSPIPKDVGTGRKKKFGGCPICWDELGKNPLASTKCGHVYCMKCLQEYLKLEKKCPTCRQNLKGSNAYHPLYLSQE